MADTLAAIGCSDRAVVAVNMMAVACGCGGRRGCIYSGRCAVVAAFAVIVVVSMVVAAIFVVFAMTVAINFW